MSTTSSSKSFEELKREMKNHWEEEIISPGDQKKKSVFFFQTKLFDYTTNCLFLELLDLQNYFKEQLKEIEFNEFFKKANSKDSDISINDFPIIFPFQNEEYFKTKGCRGSFVVDDIKKLRTDITVQTNLLEFLKDNPHFEYYFWNVTFPNMFCGFISHEYCKKAAKFLNSFTNNIDILLKGTVSFITHSYYFQNSLLKSFYLSTRHEGTVTEKVLQDSIIKATKSLTIEQLDFLDKIFNEHPNEVRDIFLNKILIHSIKLWKYSPLFSPAGNLFDSEGKCELIDFLQDKYVKDEKHEANLKNFLAPVFEFIKKKISINNIRLKTLIFDDKHELTLSLLDILIITKAANDKGHVKVFSTYIENINNRYFLTKAFRYTQVEAHFTKRTDFFKFEKPPNFSFEQLKLWDDYKAECLKYNQNPLRIFYDTTEFKSFKERNPQLVKVGMAMSHYDWLVSTQARNKLKEKAKAIIPLKTIIDAQLDFFEIYTLRYVQSHPITKNFLKSIEDFCIESMKRLIFKYISFHRFKHPNIISISEIEISLFKEKRESKKKKILKQIEILRSEAKENYKHIMFVINEELTKRMHDNFNRLFDYDENGRDRITNEYGEELKRFREEYERYESLVSVPKGNSKSFQQALIYLKYFTRAYLINTYDEQSVELDSPMKVDLPDINAITADYFEAFSASGIFTYISDLMAAYTNINLNNMAAIGQIFAAVPVLANYLRPFTVGENSVSLYISKGIGDSKELTLCILVYAFKFIKDINTEQTIEEFRRLLFTARNTLLSFNNSLPCFSQLYQDFDFLSENLGFNPPCSESE